MSDYCTTLSAGIDDRWDLGYAVAEDGESWPILIDGEYEGEQSIPTEYGWREVAPHEGGGALPAAYRVIRCEATTSAGRQCRNKPLTGTPYCGHHEDRDRLMVAIKSASCVSALHGLWAENRAVMTAGSAYLGEYKARGRQLTDEGAVW